MAHTRLDERLALLPPVFVRRPIKRGLSYAEQQAHQGHTFVGLYCKVAQFVRGGEQIQKAEQFATPVGA